MKTIRIIIADDHEFFRKGLEQVLLQNPSYQVIASVSNGQELIEKVRNLQPDLSIVDVTMPMIDGIEATRIITAQDQDAKVIALSMHDDDPIILSMMQAGAMSYIQKNTTKDEIYEAINYVVFQGRLFWPKTASADLVNRFNDGCHAPLNGFSRTFSDREVEIIVQVCKDLSIKEIADKLDLSPRTVESHRARIMKKMGVRSMAGMVAYAFKNGIYKMD